MAGDCSAAPEEQPADGGPPRLRARQLPPSAKDLLAACEARGQPIPRATVCHTSSRSFRGGLVLVADAGPGPTLYETAVDWLPRRDQATPLADLPDAAVEEAQVIFRSICPACATRENHDPDELPFRAGVWR
jgi:Fe2+ or Zn2+ uptake regulation protein